MSSFAGYRAVWSVPTARTVLILGLVCRAPFFGALVLVTLHVVERLDPRYSAAGLVTMAATIAIGISGPWRGRLLDRQGLRRTLLPSLIIGPICWVIAPWGPYWLLLVLVVFAGLFAVPVFALVRQALLGAIDPAQRRAALALDSVLAEVAFMAGPALAVWVAHYWGTAWTLMVFQLLAVAGGAVLFIANPPLRHPDSQPAPAASSVRWATPAVLGIFALTIATTAALSATDLSVVAGLRTLEQPGAIGWVLAIWGLGSAVGGLAYGAMRRSVPPWLVVAALGFFTMPVLFATSALTMAALLFVAGVFCAPSFTATTVALSRLVPEQSRGEAFGWHGSALTAGSALAAPAVGLAIDGFGWGAGFFVGGAVAFVGAAAVGLLLSVRRRTSPKDALIFAVARPVVWPGGQDPRDHGVVDSVQPSFTDVEYGNRRRVSKREQFLEMMDATIPWSTWVGVIEPHYYQDKPGKTGRKAKPVATMLRMYLLQVWFSLSDEGVEDAIYDSYAMRRFMGLDFAVEQVPDATTLLAFRHLLEKHKLGEKLFAAQNEIFEAEGWIMRGGSIVDATIIAAPSSTKERFWDQGSGDAPDP